MESGTIYIMFQYHRQWPMNMVCLFQYHGQGHIYTVRMFQSHNQWHIYIVYVSDPWTVTHLCPKYCIPDLLPLPVIHRGSWFYMSTCAVVSTPQIVTHLCSLYVSAPWTVVYFAWLIVVCLVCLLCGRQNVYTVLMFYLHWQWHIVVENFDF